MVMGCEAQGGCGRGSGPLGHQTLPDDIITRGQKKKQKSKAAFVGKNVMRSWEEPGPSGAFQFPWTSCLLWGRTL